MARLTIALAQTTARLGDPEANLEKHLAWIEDARSQGADLVVFPELSLTGYVLQDLTSSVARHATPDDALFRRLLAASRKIERWGVAVGTTESRAAAAPSVSTCSNPRSRSLAICRANRAKVVIAARPASARAGASSCR